MLEVNNKYLIIRNYDECFLNIDILKNKLTKYFVKNEKIFEKFIEHILFLMEENDDKREKIYFIINVNGKKKAYGGIVKILKNRDPVEIFLNFSFQNKMMLEFLNRMKSDENLNKKETIDTDIIIEYSNQQRKLIEMLVYAHQAIIGKIITNYMSQDYFKNLEYAELFQSGIFGLYLSIFKFNYSRKNRFSTVAFQWIKYKVSNKIQSEDPNNSICISVDLQEFNTFMTDNSKEQMTLEYQDLLLKLEKIVSTSELKYLLSNINKNSKKYEKEEFNPELLMENNEKLSKIITKIRTNLNIKI